MSRRPGVGDRIRLARELAGLSQAELAKAAGTYKTSLARWERGEVKPRGVGLRRLAGALQTTVEWLQEGGSERPPRAIDVAGLDLDLQVGGARAEAAVQATGRHGLVRDTGTDPLLYRLRALVTELAGVLAELEARQGATPGRVPSAAEVARAREVMRWVESQKETRPSSPDEGDPPRQARG